MRVGSCFTGAGLGDLGLMMAGMEIAWQIENDDYCEKILNLRCPDVPKWRDIREVDPKDLPPVDLISGGPPCQPVSVAGKRRGKADERWLWPEMLRIIQGLRPAWVLYENPTGIITMGLDGVLSDLEGTGYATAPPFIIPACAVGAPHKRYRVFVIAYSANAGIKGMCGRQDGILERVDSDADGKRLQKPWTEQRPDWFGQFSETFTHSQSVKSRKQAEWERRENSQRRDWEGSWIEAATELCRVDDGGSVRIHEFELSRAEHRRKRIEALGNGMVVPLVYEIGMAIREANLYGRQLEDRMV